MRKASFLFALLMLATACQPAPTEAAAQATSVPTATASPATPKPAATPTRVPTTAELLYPYTIYGLRRHKFQSGSITVVAMLQKTPIFTSYMIIYPSDGLQITGVMQVPNDGQPPYPVILMDHGFFNRWQYRSGDGSDRAAEYLNKHGYLTLASDYRSWGGSDPGPSLFYSGLAIDVINLLNAIPSLPQADASRVGIWGHSMGGAVTMKVLTIDSRIRAGVLYSTVSADDADVIQRWGLGCIGDIHAGESDPTCNSSDVVPLDLPPELIKAYYEASLNPDLMRATSPLYHLDLVTAPVEINYGTADGQVLSGTPPEWSKKLYQALHDAGKPAQLFAYEGQKHSFIGDSWNAFMERTARFFDEYVKNGK